MMYWTILEWAAAAVFGFCLGWCMAYQRAALRWGLGEEYQQGFKDGCQATRALYGPQGVGRN